MNGNANGLNTLKRMELEFKGESFMFTLNPQQYEIKMQNRMNLVYTKAGAFIDLFGEGIREITVNGITGFKGETNNPNHGYEQFLKLRKMFEDNMNNIEEGREVTDDDLLRFYNHTDGEAYMTVPSRLSISRNVNEPLMYKFDFLLYAVKKVGDARPNDEEQMIGLDGNADPRELVNNLIGMGINAIMGTAYETLLDRMLEATGNIVFDKSVQTNPTQVRNTRNNCVSTSRCSYNTCSA